MTGTLSTAAIAIRTNGHGHRDRSRAGNHALKQTAYIDADWHHPIHNLGEEFPNVSVQASVKEMFDALKPFGRQHFPLAFPHSLDASSSDTDRSHPHGGGRQNPVVSSTP